MNRANYILKEVTPKQYQCGVGMCPAVYELAKEECGIGACPTIYGIDKNDDNYLIIGKKLDPEKFGLEEKVGKDETLVSIPKGLIEKLKK